MSKLQEIKQLLQVSMANGTGHVDLTTYSLSWIIEQLEQGQREYQEERTAHNEHVAELCRIEKQLEQVNIEAVNYKQRYETLVQAIRNGYMFSESANGLIYQIESNTDFKLWEDHKSNG